MVGQAFDHFVGQAGGVVRSLEDNAARAGLGDEFVVKPAAEGEFGEDLTPRPPLL
jgi:hypothetical protein